MEAVPQRSLQGIGLPSQPFPLLYIELFQGWTIGGKQRDLDIASKSLGSLERETGFEPATLSLEG
jgi:hypothetical protein